MARFTIILAFATLQLAASLATCSSLAGAFSIFSKKGAACKVCGNYCGPAWCADANLAEGPACADATANWNTVTATDPTDACCQSHDKCCGTADTWKVTGSTSCNSKLKACVALAESKTTKTQPCGGDAFNDELDILGSLGDQCCGESKGDPYAPGSKTVCGSTTSPPTPAPKCNQKTTDKCTFYCNIGWWHPEGCEDGVCTCSDGYCAKGADCVAASSTTSSAKLQMSSDGSQRYRSSSGTAAGVIVGGAVGAVAAVGAVVGLYMRRTAMQEEPISCELTGADAETLYSEL